MTRKILVRVFHNGNLVELPPASVEQLAPTVHYVWNGPSDEYSWNIGGYSDTASVCLRVTSKPRRLGWCVHTRGRRLMTPGDFACLEGCDPVSDDAFQALAARFNRLFGDLPESLRPFIYVREFRAGRGTEPAYRMHPERTWLVIEGVVPSTGTDGDVDWGVFSRQSPKVTVQNALAACKNPAGVSRPGSSAGTALPAGGPPCRRRHAPE